MKRYGSGHKSWLIILSVMVLFAIVPKGFAEDKAIHAVANHAFREGEELEFELSWFGVKAGTAVMKVERRFLMNDRSVYKIVSTARSADYFAMLYRVDTSAESFMDAEGLFSWRFRIRQKEGSYSRDKELIFDYDRKWAVYSREERVTTYDIPGRVQDALSCFYYVRTQPLEVGKSLTVPTFENKKYWEVEVRVLRKEKITTPAGTFNTILIQPLLKFKGLFQHKGTVYLWVTDDQRRMPVMMQSEIKIGSIKALLTSVRGTEFFEKL
ncbi:MAG: DUF3108 domain-containing protein [Nitrospirota bacterium]|nr:DUF3108 domain-containing protein [Nitrospirota bacterium]